MVDDSLDQFNLGSGLRLMDEFLRSQNPHNENIGNENLYVGILRKIALLRRRGNETEEDCYIRLENDSKRFLQIYNQRAGNPKHEKWNGRIFFMNFFSVNFEGKEFSNLIKIRIKSEWAIARKQRSFV